MKDVIGGSDMTRGDLASFTTDRFGNINSALALNGGWTQLPSGIYFDSPEFTISLWIFQQKIGYWSRILDFGNAEYKNIVLTLAFFSKPKIDLEIFDGLNNITIIATSSQYLTENNWQFIVATFNGTNTRLYLNGILTAESNQSYSMPVTKRTNCYIGKSSDPSNGYSHSVFDDLRFYNKSLSQNEILELMNYNETSKTPFNYFFVRS